jgi:apolipoprotein N-acyltransferase
LINITDDSWFGKSLAAEQQLQIGRMRSLEAGRYQIVATNNGVTAIIKPDGKVQSKAPVFQEYVLTDYVYAMNGTTPWVKFGHYLWLVLTFGGIFLCWRRNTKSQN